MISTDTTLWEDLLLAIEEGQVVPLIGRDLLVVETDAGPRLYHHIVAERLAAQLNISPEHLPADFDPNDVICAYENFHGDPMAINPRVVRIVKDLKVAVPEPLKQLAAIENFGLFVSTTYDTLMEEAITQVRKRPPAVVAFPAASQHKDFDDALLERNGSLVFQIFGRVSASAPFALTEGQVLEQVHELMGNPNRPNNLITRLQQSHLLILGVSFPDWLTRFLLRLARAKPLWDSRPMMEVIADSRCASTEQTPFALFLRHFSPQQSRLFAGVSPVDFVRELHQRWFERHPESASAAAPEAVSEKPAQMAPGSIFVSYASEDRQEAFSLADRLSAAGLEAWVDRRINPGDDYRYLIERNIRECAAFIPVLSRHTQVPDARWFRREWDQACQMAKSYFGTDRAFLFPVVVDSTANADLIEFKRDLFQRSAARAMGGEPPLELIDQLDAAQKAWRRQFARV
jgi:hypothetical protein